ncbi:hypothetical protein EVG20_g7383, partial [Dentipellis fragilis]
RDVPDSSINQHLDAGCPPPVAPLFNRLPPPKRPPPGPSPHATPSKRHKASISARLHAAAPLAERLRPQSLAEFVGHPHLTAPDSPFFNLVQNVPQAASYSGDRLARLLAKRTDAVYKELSATIAGINDVRPIFEEAKNTLQLTGRRTILFLDEVHRFTKPQQARHFLAVLGARAYTAYRRNYREPFLQVDRRTSQPLSSSVFALDRLTDEDVTQVVERAIARSCASADDTNTGLVVKSPDVSQPQSSSQTSLSSQSSNETLSPSYTCPQLTPRVLASLVSLSTGDARTALSLLEIVLASPPTTPESTLLASLRRSVSASYDRSGDSRYDLISALHKSVRGSQGSAALYWLARMLEAGEDPLYIARRMVVCASEDIGLADNHALPLAMATLQACQLIGMPECRINLAHLVSYLAEAPKSTRAYEAYKRAAEAAKLDLTLPVPLQIRNAPTGLMKEMGYSKGYCYNPDYAHPVTNEYVPIQFRDEVFLREEGDKTDKIWDEEELRRWEREENGGKDWDGRLQGNESMG